MRAPGLGARTFDFRLRRRVRRQVFAPKFSLRPSLLTIKLARRCADASLDAQGNLDAGIEAEEPQSRGYVDEPSTFADGHDNTKQDG